MDPTVSVMMTSRSRGEPPAPRSRVEGREHLVGGVHLCALRGSFFNSRSRGAKRSLGTPAVDLELRLAGSPSADAAGESRQRDLGALREPRQQVLLELRQDELRAVYARG